MLRSLRQHWPEYLMEAAELGLFMISAGIVTILIWNPASPVSTWIPSELMRRALTCMAMGLNRNRYRVLSVGQAIGRALQSGSDTQFSAIGKGETMGRRFLYYCPVCRRTCRSALHFGAAPWFVPDAPVSYVATRPGPTGPWIAFGAEIFISFLLMSTLLYASNKTQLSRFTGLFAGLLVATFITFESPFSGMSMNPARTFSSALPAGFLSDLWIYFVAPITRMLLAVEIRKRLFRGNVQACAKLHHENNKRCIFCGRGMRVFALFLLSGLTLPAQIRGGAVGPIAITVSDLDQSINFYTQVLCFHEESEQRGRLDSFDRLTGIFGTNIRIANLQLGTGQIQVVQFVTPQGRKYPDDSRSNDEWFQHIAIVVRDMNAAYARLSRFKVWQISSDPQTLPEWNKNAAGIKAFYFRDPDGHPLELIYFPPGKGDPRWQRNGNDLFLGIDHTAIAVENTDRSVAFYRESHLWFARTHCLASRRRCE